ncbi:hypothetical protein HOLleu_44115 [Holothuria leucospilota]|uniref:CUB domain-containing protein n=1 Tax=Holothuria leucospilota TaxID=206669 RepID=A0A9Q0YAW0_HOLLE|nr:hypothetical protein HOLleu_44115 [Holothuria leucospilota]
MSSFVLLFSATDFTVIPTPTSDADFTEACSETGTTVRLQYASESSNAILGSPTYFTGSGVLMSCVWTIIGPTGSYLAIIFRNFQLELAVDGFEIRYLDQRFAFGHTMYSSNVMNLPVTRAGTTLPLIGTPIILDSSRVRLTYDAQTSDLVSYPGPIFEVHVLGKGNVILFSL